MIKLLPLAFIPLIVFSVIAYSKFNANSNKPSPGSSAIVEASLLPEVSISANPSPKEVPKTLPVNPKPSTAGSINSEARIKSLEDNVFSLQQQIANLKANQSSTSQTSSSTSKSPQYVYSLGTGGSTTSITSWTTIDSLSLTIDPGNYSGYKDMVLEVYGSLYQGNGTAYFRLYNKAAGVAITDSEISTSAYNYTWFASKPFKLGSGSQVFYPQLKTSTGYAAQIQDFRIKVNY